LTPATASPYEQLKDGFGYLQLGRAVECFATLAEEAKAKDWSHVEFLARVIADQAASTTNRRLAARLRFARFPYHRKLDDFDFEFVRHEAPCNRVGCRSPPPNCRSSSVKLRAA
jgi:DNA replication protein DnaC